MVFFLPTLYINVYLCYHHYSGDTEQFHHHKYLHVVFLLPHTTHSLAFTIWQPMIPSPYLFFFFRRCYIKGIIKCIIFESWLYSLSITPSSFIQVIACINSLFLFISEYSMYFECTMVHSTIYLLTNS